MTVPSFSGPWVEHVERMEAMKRHRDGECICNNGPDTDGPDEFCPWHGRRYVDLVDALVAQAAELNRANRNVEMLTKQLDGMFEASVRVDELTGQKSGVPTLLAAADVIAGEHDELARWRGMARDLFGVDTPERCAMKFTLESLAIDLGEFGTWGCNTLVEVLSMFRMQPDWGLEHAGRLTEWLEAETKWLRSELDRLKSVIAGDR